MWSRWRSNADHLSNTELSRRRSNADVWSGYLLADGSGRAGVPSGGTNRATPGGVAAGLWRTCAVLDTRGADKARLRRRADKAVGLQCWVGYARLSGCCNRRADGSGRAGVPSRWADCAGLRHARGRNTGEPPRITDLAAMPRRVTTKGWSNGAMLNSGRTYRSWIACGRARAVRPNGGTRLNGGTVKTRRNTFRQLGIHSEKLLSSRLLIHG